MTLPIILYSVLLAVAICAPLRWAIVSYLVLSVVDFYAGNSTVGILNAVKGLGYPLLLLWRLRPYSGHTRIVTAPVAWILFVSYALIASFWSLFPLSAVKLVGEMTGSFLICMAFMRATKGGFLRPSVAWPVAIGAVGIAVIRTIFMPKAGDTADRFTAFTSGQAFASLLAALYALALCSRSIRPSIRITLGVGLAATIIADGSRLWTLALIVATIFALLVSEAKTWVKIFGIAGIGLGCLAVVAAAPFLIDVLRGAQVNRVAATITAVYEGNEKADGLGTYKLRRQLDARAIAMIETGSVLQILFGHGTSNGRLVRGNLNQGAGDPNRSVHNEWLRIVYEWGVVGMFLWLLFIGSVMAWAYRGMQKDSLGLAKPLFIYVPAFCVGLSGENILAGAGHAENIGLLLLIAIASIAHRQRTQYMAPVAMQPVPMGRNALRPGDLVAS